MHKKLLFALLFLCLGFAYTTSKAAVQITGVTNEMLSCTLVGFQVFPSSTQNVIIKFVFHDGTTEMVNDSAGAFYATHDYPFPGAFAVKIIAIENNIASDSTEFTYTKLYDGCADISYDFYIDANSNCVKDPSEEYAAVPVSVAVWSMIIPADTFQCLNGFKTIVNTVQEDVITSKIVSIPTGIYLTCPADSLVEDEMILGNSNVFHHDVGLNCLSGNMFDLSVNVNVPVTGAIDQWGNIFPLNSFCYGPNATLVLQHSPKYEYNGGASPAPTSVNGNTLTWDLGSYGFGSDPEMVYFVLWAPPGQPLTFGDTVHNHIYIDPGTGDLDPYNNAIVKVDTVVAGCDPNAIYVYPDECVVAGDELEYTVTFENIGNGPVDHVFVLDTLPAELDVKTLEIKFNSHYMTYARRMANGQNIILFDFPNIDLADSSDHINCHGMFKYTIKNFSNTPVGTEIGHRVGIYFDYNGVILTNTATTEVCNPAAIEEIANKADLVIYPNPANDILSVSSSKGKAFEITNMLGQVMMTGSLNSTVSQINVETLSTGVYNIKVTGDRVVNIQKFQKL